MSEHAAIPAPAPEDRASRGMVALGFRLARGGVMSGIAIGVAVLTTFAAIVVAVLIAEQRGVTAPLHDVPSLTASALAWGAGVMLAFAAARQALRRDRDEGIRALVRARGGSASAYVWGRVVGLVVFVALVVVSGTVLATLACLAVATRENAGLVLRGGVAAIAYAAVFAATVGPIAMAALGARSRAGGYVSLLAVLVLPELFERWTATLLPYAWRDFASIPSALAQLRSALMPPAAVDVARLGRAAVVLLVVCAGALFVLRRQLASLDEEGRA